MNNLYYVSAYHFRSNAWWRYLLTAENETTAKDIVLQRDTGLSSHNVKLLYVCQSPTEVFLEL